MRRPLLALFRFVVRSIYFRDVEEVGDAPSADVRGRLFAANHLNGLVDPILVMTGARCPISPLAKAPLWKIFGLRTLLDAVGAVPVRRKKDDPSMKTEDNDEAFAKVAERLASGGNVLIFPEGVSHNEPHVQKLKTGAARMLARAHAQGTKGLTFQAVGLEFEQKETFRSRALVVYGPVRSVDALEGDVVRAITEQLRADLEELVVEGATLEERRTIARVAEMFSNESGDAGSLARWNEVGRRVEAARKRLGDDGAYEAIAREVAAYWDALEASGVGDRDVADPDARPPRKKRKLALLAATLPLAIPGALLYWVPYQIPRLVARGIPDEERDVMATKKIGAGLVAFPVWAALLVGGSFVLLPPPLAVGASAVVVASPFAALVWLDWLDDRRARRGAKPEAIERLRAMRAEVMARLQHARAELEGSGASIAS